VLPTHGAATLSTCPATGNMSWSPTCGKW
jgi:hypothetical protein